MPSQEERYSGISLLGKIPWGSHICQFYETQEDLIDILIPYFKAGLENNEYCIWITSFPLTPEKVKEEITKKIPDFEDYLRKGQIEIFPHTEWYLKDGIFDAKRIQKDWKIKLDTSLKNGYDGLRVTGSNFWLKEKDWQKFIDYEENSNKVIGDYKMIALCTYSVNKYSSQKIIDIVCNHQKAIIKRNGSWTVIQSAELKKTKNDLEQSEEKFHRLFDSMADGVSIVELVYSETGKIIDYIFIDINNAYQNIVGCKREERIGKKATDLYGKAFKLDVLDNVNSTHKPQCYEFYNDFLKQHFQVSAFYMGKNKIGTIFSDITEHKKNEETLLKNEIKERSRALELETIIEAVPAAVWIAHDPECKVITGNRTSYEILRLRPGLNVSKSAPKDETPNTFFMSHDGKRMNPEEMPIQRASRGEIVKNNYFDVVFEDGTQLHLHGNAVPLLDSQGKSRGSVGVFLDITKRKEMEDELKEAMEKTRLLINHAPTAIYEIDLKSGRFTQVNDVMCKILGYSREELLSLSPFDVLVPESVILFKDRIKKQLAGEKINDVVEYKVLTKDNRELCVVLNSSFIYEDGKPVATFVIAHDITERKKNQAKIKHLASFPYFSPRPIVELDMNGKIVYCNPCVLNLFFDIEKKSLKHPLLYGIDLIEVKKTRFINREVNVDFKWYQQEIFYIPEIDMVRIYSSDITKRKEAEQKLHNFLAVLGHELRNPLSSILLLTDLLEVKMVNDSESKNTFEQLKHQIQNMSDLLKDLLDISFIELGKIKIRKKEIDIIALIRKVTEVIKPILEKNNQKLELIIPNDSIFIMADPLRIEQVLVNLLNNSSKFSNKDSSIRLTLEKDNNQVLIKIRDYGVGICSDSLIKIFNLFVQENSFSDIKNEGFGIGLYLSRQLVCLHDGDINVFSEGLKKGSEFIINLPIKNKTNKIKKQKTISKKQSKPKVLIVDDNIIFCETLGKVISTLGYETKIADDGKKAFKTIEDFNPDVVFIDLVMPEIDGLTLVKKIRSNKKNSKITLIAMTGYGQDINKKSIQEAGFDNYMLKPISVKDLSKIFSFHKYHGRP